MYMYQATAYRINYNNFWSDLILENENTRLMLVFL